ncbi:MAG: A/G-specific adenine glycosylase [Chloroflexota bacterium]|nr:A/G-specific adenine glycosylase [Chloroflexota bacterium]
MADDPALAPEPRDAVAPELQEAILDWYAARARTLPFRGTTDPYAILVSEAMAQQTQAARAGEAWTGFMARFPTVEALAAALLADVLRAWQGLGYNRRAVNLWRAAGRIVSEFGGEVPADLAALESLPGVGPYTARAVGAIAFGMPVGAVDTNVRRVLGRIVAGDARALGPSELQRAADAAVPAGRAGEWTHALMDIGAMICRPRRPDCVTCPARAWCRYAGEAGAAERTGRAAGAVAAAAREAHAPFHATSRWLRGRILDRLREESNGDWVTLDAAIGGHGMGAVSVAVQALAKDGLLELDAGSTGPIRARLPII